MSEEFLRCKGVEELKVKSSKLKALLRLGLLQKTEGFLRAFFKVKMREPSAEENAELS